MSHFFIRPCYSLVFSSRIVLIYSLITKNYYLGSNQCGASPHFRGAGILFNADQRFYDTFSLSNFWRTHSNIGLVWMWTCPKWAIFNSNRCNTNDGNSSRHSKNRIFKLQPWRCYDTTWRIVVVYVYLPNDQTGTVSSCIKSPIQKDGVADVDVRRVVSFGCEIGINGCGGYHVPRRKLVAEWSTLLIMVGLEISHSLDTSGLQRHRTGCLCRHIAATRSDEIRIGE